MIEILIVIGCLYASYKVSHKRGEGFFYAYIPTDQIARYMEELNSNIDELPKEYQKVYRFHHVYGFKLIEIVEMFNIPIKRVEQIISESEELIKLY